MKPTTTMPSLITSFRQPLIAFILIFVMLPNAENPAQQVYLQTGNVSQFASVEFHKSSASAAVCQWSYYPVSGGKLQPEQLLFNDPDNTPVVDLSLGSMFKGKSAQLASTGSTDFDGDNKTDVFRTIPRMDGNLQWQYSSGGTGAWQDLAYASSALPVSQLQFGDFNGDLNTDVFASLYNNSLFNYEWVYSPSGTDSFVNLKPSISYPNRLALGDFNGDGVTDVFSATQKAGTYQWAYSPSGSGATLNLAYAATDPSLLKFGDFNGDGKTDVFAAAQLPDGSTQWLYSSGGASSYTNLITTTVPYSELKFGDFNGDGTTDVLAAQPQSDGGLQVVYWPGGLGSGITLGHIPAPAPALRVGDFNGDGVSDLMALRCGMPGPLAFSPVQTLAQSGYGTFFHTLAGDINGDGRADVILISSCQNPNSFGTCASHHLQVGPALGTPAHTFTLSAPHQLGADNIDFTYYKILSGDFNGDGKTDLALVNLTGIDLTIYMATSNGDGTFTLGSQQLFGGETWSNFNPVIGDFNGDGKSDLALSSVCYFAYGSCSNGDNNIVYVATSNGAGSFTLSARHDLGTTGMSNFMALAGDFNGDGKTDLVFNSTCQKKNFVDSTCTDGNANLVYTALSNGVGGFTLSTLQNYGSLNWSDYPYFSDLAGDLNGDGRSDLIWTSSYQTVAKTSNNLVVAGFANPDGTFQVGSTQNFGSAWTGGLTLADLNRDGKADLVWNNASLGETDVDTYAAATSNGDGTFNNLGPGSVFTGQGYFHLTETNAAEKISSGLVIVSTRQDSIGNALFIMNSFWQGGTVYLPFLKK